MADNKAILAQQMYQTLCDTLDQDKWRYDKDEKNLRIIMGVQGEELPMTLYMEIDQNRCMVGLYSPLPYTIPEDKRVEVAVAVNVVNNTLVDGYLDYDIFAGKLLFRAANSYVGNQLHGEVFRYMLYSSCHIIDDFNDKLLMLSKGVMDVPQFIETYTKE